LNIVITLHPLWRIEKRELGWSPGHQFKWTPH